MPIPPKHAIRPDGDVAMSEAMFHILLCLTDGPQHGYGIMRAVDEATGGEVQLRPGTLYRTMRQLLDTGWVKVSSRTDEHDTRRVPYKLTPSGREAVTAEGKRLARMVALARARRLVARDYPT